MANLKTVEPAYEYVSDVEHPEHQVVNTRVSHYMRMYATGKISEFPTTAQRENAELPEGIRQDLLNRNLPLPSIGTDPVEILDYLNENKTRYQDMVNDYNLALRDREQYDAAISVIEDSNSDATAVANAMRTLEAIEKKARARYT